MNFSVSHRKPCYRNGRALPIVSQDFEPRRSPGRVCWVWTRGAEPCCKGAVLRARGPVHGRRVLFTGRPRRPGACPASRVVEGDYTDGADGQPAVRAPIFTCPGRCGQEVQLGRALREALFSLACEATMRFTLSK